MKILLTGASGLLGNAYASAAVRRGHEVIALANQHTPVAGGISRSLQIDLRAPDPLTSLCLEIWPDAIVNCAAISNPASVEADPKLAEKINVALPRHLAQLSNHLGARLIHISTDMVFDGRAEEPYRSTDMPAPTNLYGQTKLMAEREVLEHNPEDPVVLRIPILMGNSPGGRRSVHEKLISAIQAGERPRLFCDEIRQPTSAENVAEVMLELSERRDLHGIFHWAGSETVSRYEMGQRILRHFGLDLDTIESVSQKDTPGQADRPSHLTFNLHPLISKIKTQPLNFEEQLEELTRVDPLQA
ncbi:NAD(P)-dependent oxidoreductase [Coraliomargarita sinensis]|uniref:dTDP-4-dehydrorhamnose reductase n=1 Tax=Coraliomargarita sinensis TaxID=2174842 RepID=A0A317ZN73_9BACT|nr:SDR family oxidoreductase [Coraliomargarita sinensis]PXA05683.1 NAD(P)-dependent oxidoreductase [Coraliomargarita sinensis]